MTLLMKAPSDGSSTIFDFRLQSAQRNLNELRKLVDSIRDRNDHLYELQSALAKDRSEIDAALAQLRDRIDMAKKYASSDWGVDKSGVEFAVNEADKYFNELKRHFNHAKKHATEISVLQLDATALSDRNKEFSDKINDGGENLENISVSQHRREVGPAQSWENLKAQSRVWEEYLDYLAGLSLRHEGLPAGVCDIADALIKELQGQSRESAALAIPGREGCVGILPKVVYLRFPEWTVWSLPLAAHEFWHIMESSEFSKQSSFLEYFTNRLKRALDSREQKATFHTLKEKFVNPGLLSECLADTFAAFTMGPAYAYSCVLLVLNPLESLHQLRAQAILRALDYLEKDDRYAGFRKIHDTLAALWKQAIEEAGVTATDVPENLQRWTDELLSYLTSIPGLPFPTREWGSLDLLHAFTKDERIDERKLIEEKGLTIRLVLAAAWQTRMECPEEYDRISGRCYRLCAQITPNPGNRTPGPINFAR